jgi:hypothetical protein
MLAVTMLVMLLFAAFLNALAPAGGPGRGRSEIVIAAVSGVALAAVLVRHRIGRR